MKRYWWVLLAAAGLLIAGFVIVRGRARARAAEAEAAVTYTAVRVIKGSVTVSVDATGKMAAAETVDLTPPKDGKVMALLVEAGDYVRRGQVLARLDTSSADVQLVQLEANVNQARLSSEAAKAEYERMQRLFDSQAVTSQQVDAAKDKAENAADALKVAQAQLAEAQAKAGAGNETGTAVVTAPLAGVVTQVNAQVGATVSAKVPLISLTDPSRLTLEAQVDENDIAQVKVGQRAQITLDALPDEEYAGQVTAVGGLGQEQNGVVLYTVKIALANAKGHIKLGMNADASIVILDRPNVLTVPNAAVETRMGRSVVRLYLNGGETRYRPVTIGLRTDAVTEIVEGLSEGDRVAVAAAKTTTTTTNGGNNENGSNRRGNGMFFMGR